MLKGSLKRSFLVYCRVFRFLRRSADEKHLKRFQRENTAWVFFRVNKSIEIIKLVVVVVYVVYAVVDRFLFDFNRQTVYLIISRLSQNY